MPNGAQDRSSRIAGETREFADMVRDQAESYVEKRRADMARIVSDIGGSIRDTGTSFDGLPQLKAFFDQAALGVDDLAEDIARRSFGQMYDEVYAAVRRRPALTAAAALLAGFALFRALHAQGIRPVPRSRAIVPADALSAPDL